MWVVLGVRVGSLGMVMIMWFSILICIVGEMSK